MSRHRPTLEDNEVVTSPDDYKESDKIVESVAAGYFMHATAMAGGGRCILLGSLSISEKVVREILLAICFESCI
jgi:hypothetical protein